MSTLENVTVYGNIDLLAAPNTSDQGLGNIYIANDAAISGTSVSTSYSSGALTVVGGFGVGGAVYANNNMNVNGISNLKRTNINTNDGVFSVTGSNNTSINITGALLAQMGASSSIQTSAGNLTFTSSAGNLELNGNTAITANSSAGGINMTAAASSSLTTTLGNLLFSSPGTSSLSGNTLVSLASSAGAVYIDGNSGSYFTVTGSFPLTLSSTAGAVNITSGLASTTAVNIASLNLAGGITLDAGTNGINGVSTGAILLEAANASSHFILDTNAGSQNLTLALTGATNSSLNISSEGTGATAVNISNTSLTGGIKLTSGTTGYDNASTGPVSIDAAGTSNFTTTGAYNLTLNSTGGNAIVQGGGSTSSAVTISTTDSAGGIDINSGTSGYDNTSTGPISIDAAGTSNFTTTGNYNLTLSSTGGNAILEGGGNSANSVTVGTTHSAGGITVTSGTNGYSNTSTAGISLNAANASNLTVSTTANNQDLNILLTGATDSEINLSSAGTGTTALNMSTSAGGILLSSAERISVQSVDTLNGIKIGTATVGVPITIGNATTSTVTIGQDMVVTGNFTVSGTTTTVNTATVTVEDNIVVYNSAPSGTADSGSAIKRYQTVNGATDDIVSDTPNQTSAGHGGNTQAGATATTIVLNAGASAATSYYNGWWIKITSGANSGHIRRIKAYNGTTKIATIYGTADSDSSYPTNNLDLSNPYTDYVGVSYSLYGNVFIASVYQESSDRWILCSVPLEPSVGAQLTPLKYIDFQVGSLYSTGSVNTNTINAFSGTAVTVSNVTIDNGALTGVVSINGNTPDSVVTVTLPDNNSTSVDISSTTTTGCYSILVKANYAGGPMAQFTAVKSLAATNSTPNRTASSVGSNGERIELTWTATNKARLKFQTNPGTSSTYAFIVKVISP